MTIQQLAKLAKNRIKSGYWKQECNSVNTYCSDMDTDTDKAMYEIVTSIIESDEVVTNPLSKLINKDYYDSLSDEAKSRYMLDLSRQYVKMTERYNSIKKSI